MPFSELFYHIVFGIESKDRLHNVTAKLVSTKLVEEVAAIGGKALATKLMPDHVHILLAMPPVASPDDIVEVLKERTSELVEGMGRDEKLKWAHGYGVVSVSKSHVDIVKKYISSQEKRHAENKLNETLEKFAV